MKKNYILKDKKNIAKIFSIFVVLLFCLISCGKKEEGIEYEVTKVGMGDISLSVSKTGQVVSDNVVSVYTSSSQRVKDVFFKTGDNVETLRKIQMKNLEIQKYERNLASAQSSLRRKKETKSLEIQQKSRDLHNAEELYKVGGETRVNVDDARKALRTSKLESDTVDSEERTNIEDARTALKTAKLELATLQEDMTLIKNEITSPVDGVITEMTADENYKVNTESTLFKVSDSKNMKVEVSLSDTQVKNIEVGQRVEITSDALPKGEKVEGYVSQIAGVAKKSENLDESDTTVTIKMNDTKNLRPGTTISATIFYEEKRNVVKVPYSAVMNENGKYFVFTVGKDKKITKKEVKVGVSDESNYEITSGLNMGESIISVVDETLKDGQKIKIADPKKPKKDNKKIIKSQDVESVPAGEAAPGGPGPM